jgi:hypothetical protein
MRRDGGFEMEVGMTLAEQLAGRICSLSFEALPADVVELAGSEASGTLEYDRAGGDVKRLFPAMAARSGVEAALEQLSDLGDLVDLTVGARS